MNKKVSSYYLILLVLLSLILCSWGIQFGLPQLLHDDEQVFVKRALRFGSGDLNPHFFFYPSLHMYILFFAYGIYFVMNLFLGIFHSVKDFAHSYICNPTDIYLIGRSVSAFSGVLVIGMTYFIGKKIYEKNVGLLAGLFLLAIPRFVEIAHYIRPDATMLFTLMVFFYICLQIYHTGERKFYILAGLVLGLATALKYNSIILAPIIFFVHLFYNYKKVKPITLFLNLDLFLSGLFLFFGFTIGCPFWLLDFNTFFQHFLQLITFTATDKQFGQPGALLNYFNLMLHLGGERIFLGGICIVSLLIGIFRKKKIDWLVILPVVIVYLVCARQRIQQWQYLYPAFPFLALLGAKFIYDSYKAIPSKYTKFVFILVVATVLIDPINQSALNDYWISQKDPRMLAKEWIEQNIPEHSKILLDPKGPQLLRSKKLIQQQYELAVKLNHLKKDYFKLQLESLTGKEYWWYHIERSIVCPPEMKEYSQQVELTERLDPGIDYLKKKDFEYIIIAPSETITEEEKMLDNTCELLKEFRPRRYVLPLIFRVKIYKIK